MVLVESTKKSLKFSIGILLILFFLLIMYIFLMDKLNKEEYIKIFDYSYFKIISGSMEKEIKVNDLVIVKLTSDVKKNDIITYKREDNKIITHRIIKIEEDTIITKGDANFKEDRPIYRNQIIGKVIFHLNSSTIYYTISTLLLIYIILIITDLKKTKKERINHKGRCNNL